MKLSSASQLTDLLSTVWPTYEVNALHSLLSLFDTFINHGARVCEQPTLDITPAQKALFVQAVYSELSSGNLDPIGKAFSFYGADAGLTHDNQDFRLCIHAGDRQPLTVKSYSSLKSGSGLDVQCYLLQLANGCLSNNVNDPFHSLWIRLEDPSRSKLIAAYVQIALLMKAISERVGKAVSPFCVELVSTHV